MSLALSESYSTSHMSHALSESYFTRHMPSLSDTSHVTCPLWVILHMSHALSESYSTERLVHNQVYNYLTDHGILSPNQSGFRKGYSTGTCLIEFLHHIYTNIDASRVSGVLFLDFSKAFDTVSHEIMLSKLKHLRFKPDATLWFGSYLTNRSQITKIRNARSNPAPIIHGVPQGSILGPLLFTLYVNDLPLALPECHVSHYADDTAVVVSDTNLDELQRKLSSAMNNIIKWYQKKSTISQLEKIKTYVDQNESITCLHGERTSLDQWHYLRTCQWLQISGHQIVRMPEIW